MTTGRGRGKVILLGEHAVVHGHPALCGALALDVVADARPAREDRLVVPAWAVDRDADPRAGLGSSAALGVALARALAPAAPDDVIERAALAGERVFHGNPSGVDVALATRGGVGLFRRGEGLAPVAVAPFRLAVGLSGVPRDTARRVADVQRRREAAPAETDRHLAALGELARAGRDALLAGDLAALGGLFTRAQAELAALGLSSPPLDRLCALAAGAGALGAKLTGAGGGGAVIALGHEQDVARAWRQAGFHVLLVEVGAT